MFVLDATSGYKWDKPTPSAVRKLVLLGQHTVKVPGTWATAAQQLRAKLPGADLPSSRSARRDDEVFVVPCRRSDGLPWSSVGQVADPMDDDPMVHQNFW